RVTIQRLRDVGVPVADVEARAVADIEAALEGRLVGGLREAAETIVREQAGIAGDRPVGLRRISGLGQGRQHADRGKSSKGEKRFLHVGSGGSKDGSKGSTHLFAAFVPRD